MGDVLLNARDRQQLHPSLHFLALPELDHADSGLRILSAHDFQIVRHLIGVRRGWRA